MAKGLSGIDNAAAEKGKGIETVWQFVKFIFVSLLAMIVQFTLLNVLPLIPAIKNLYNPFYLAQNIDSYAMCCKIVISMLDDFKTECHLTDEVLRIMQTEIQCAADMVQYKSEGITFYWDKIKRLVPCVEKVLDKNATWYDYEDANKEANEILDMFN